jgi:imidazoleglycerol-phosphate dehydratase
MLNRISEITRKTKETNIKIRLNLDGTGECNIDTGIGFFNHMLTQFAVHGLFDLDIEATGDLYIDVHHTIEDIGICLGKAIRRAVGEKLGINRVGNAFVPMDEALAFVALDISGRPYWIINITWNGHYLGGSSEFLVPTSIIEHFFQSLAVHSGITIHIREEVGKDNHHIAESVFKAFSRALDHATRIDTKRRDMIPSTKGMLE